MGRRLVLVCVLVAVLGGCSRAWDRNPPVADASGVGMQSDGTVVEGAESTASIRTAPRQNDHGLVPPFGSNGVLAAYESGPGYRIGAGDRLTIRVLGQTDLTNDYIVDGAGDISLPLINTVRVGGLTAPEAERVIAARLRQGYLRAPNVSVQVTNLRPFYILGEVNEAGSYPYQNGMTVQNAVAIANGYSPRANQGNVLLTRKSGKGTISSRVPVTTQIYPGDIIYVRERWF